MRSARSSAPSSGRSSIIKGDMTRDSDIVSRLWRRMRSARGSVYLEFGALAPIAMALVLFAHDFTKILYVEQQLEVAARVACDIEAHLDDSRPRPHKITKVMTKNYLKRTLGLAKPDDAYIKGDIQKTPGLSEIVDKVNKFFNGSGGSSKGGNAFLNFIKRLLGGIIKIVTLGTHNYLLTIPPKDQMVRVTVSARVPRFFPLGKYGFLDARGDDDARQNMSLIVQAQPELTGEAVGFLRKPKSGERTRYYCVMPYFDTGCRPPPTFVRGMRGWFGKWLPDSVWPKDD